MKKIYPVLNYRNFTCEVHMIIGLNGKTPQTEKASFIAENSTIVGDVAFEKGVSVWYGAVIRGDSDSIRVGNNSNIQDNVVVHVDPGNPVSIGSNVTIGHNCVIHGCTIGDNCLIGMGAIIMNGAKIGDNCLVGAGALITENKEFPSGSKILGSPAKIKSEVSDADLELISYSADYYKKEATAYSEISAH